MSVNVTARRENGRRRPRGYADWRPQAKTKELLASVEDVLDEYRDHLPLSVRQIFYRLVATRGYEKTELAYNRLAEALVRARRARHIDFDLIRDDGVVTVHRNYYADPDDFWDAVGGWVREYRRDRQEGQRVRVELLHVGDFDPSGESIFEAMAADAAAFVEADRLIETLHIEPVRVALTAEQVAAYDLPTAPAKPTDGRSAGWEGGTCQLEALAPDVLAELVSDAIRKQLDLTRWRDQVEGEHDDRIHLFRALPSGEPS